MITLDQARALLEHPEIGTYDQWNQAVAVYTGHRNGKAVDTRDAASARVDVAAISQDIVRMLETLDRNQRTRKAKQMRSRDQEPTGRIPTEWLGEQQTNGGVTGGRIVAELPYAATGLAIMPGKEPGTSVIVLRDLPRGDNGKTGFAAVTGNAMFDRRRQQRAAGAQWGERFNAQMRQHWGRSA